MLFASLLIQPIQAEGATGGDFLSSMTPALKQLGGLAMQNQEAQAAQETAQVDGKKEDFQNMMADKQAQAQAQQQQAASVVKGFPILDPHSAYLSAGYKNQRNAMFQRSINKAAADFKRTNSTTQAALAAEEKMTNEAMGAVSGVVGKLADQMNKSDEEADKLERDEIIAACARNTGQCTPDADGFISVSVDGKTKKMKADEALLAEIQKASLQQISNNETAIDLGILLKHNKEANTYTLDTSRIDGYDLLSQADKDRLAVHCVGSMNFNQAKACAAKVQATQKIATDLKNSSQTDRANKAIMEGLKDRLEAIKGIAMPEGGQNLERLMIAKNSNCNIANRNTLDRFTTAYTAASSKLKEESTIKVLKGIHRDADTNLKTYCESVANLIDLKRVQATSTNSPSTTNGTPGGTNQTNGASTVADQS